GRNFAAGMSNGIAYILDEHRLLESRCNLEMVAVSGLNSMDERVLRKLIQQHFHKSGSARARAILAHWETYRALFRKVAPPAVAVSEPVTPHQSTGSPAGSASPRSCAPSACPRSRRRCSAPGSPASR